jgi:hypothetical protein
MAAAIPLLPLISAGVTAVGLVMQGRAANAAGKYNAALAEQNAATARQEAAMMAQQQDRENFLRLGAIRAAQGKSGGAADEGSVLDVIGDAVSQGELQKQYITRTGEMKARGYEGTAALDRANGRNSMTAGYLSAGASLLGGASSYYGNVGSSGRSAYNSDFTLKRA